MSRARTRALLDQLLSKPPVAEAVFDQVWALSEGNPLVIVEAARGLERATLAPSAQRLPVPPRVRALIVERISALDALPRDLLATAAVIGCRFEFALFERVCDACEAPVLAAALERLVARGILRSADQGLCFAHGRIREVVYEELLPARRSALHDAVARAVTQLGADRQPMI